MFLTVICIILNKIRPLVLRLVGFVYLARSNFQYFRVLKEIYLAEFLKTPQNGPEYSHRNLAIARVLVTAVRKDIGGLLSWLVSLSSSVPELTRHGLGMGLHVNP